MSPAVSQHDDAWIIERLTELANRIDEPTNQVLPSPALDRHHRSGRRTWVLVGVVALVLLGAGFAALLARSDPDTTQVGTEHVKGNETTCRATCFV
jgi:ferric-dicitrate binding protein FerR (iron transport regulator)